MIYNNHIKLADGTMLPKSTIVLYGGGLGDVIHDIYALDNYLYMDKPDRGEFVINIVTSHNSAAKELFEYHPMVLGRKAGVLFIPFTGVPWKKHACDYMGIDPARVRSGKVLTQPSKVKLYMSESDKHIIGACSTGRYAVLHPFAGTPERCMSTGLVNKIILALLRRNIRVCIVGKTYCRTWPDRNGTVRSENTSGFHKGARVVDLTSSGLSIVGTIELIKRSCLFVGSHSSMCIVAWHNRKKSIVLYDETAKERDYRVKNRWSFGKDFPTTRHGLFNNFSPSMIDDLLR